MKSTHFFFLGWAFLFLTAATLHAEDWITIDGKAYKNVTVIKVELDSVTILHHDGGGRISLANLPPDLQQRFNFDPKKAKAAADARALADAKNAVVLQAEIEQAKVQRRIEAIESDPRIQFSFNLPTGPISASTSTNTTDGTAPTIITESGPDGTVTYNIGDLSHDPLAPAARGPNQHSMDELVDINSRLKDDHGSANRHTAASLLVAASHLMPDPLDPTHHSTEELTQSMHNLTPPPTDTGNRHSTDSLVNRADPLARP